MMWTVYVLNLIVFLYAYSQGKLVEMLISIVPSLNGMMLLNHLVNQPVFVNLPFYSTAGGDDLSSSASSSLGDDEEGEKKED